MTDERVAATRIIDVVAAIIERDGRWLVSKRQEGTHLAGLWEFPGGKCEPGETHEAALVREIDEELGVGVSVGPAMLVTEHAYADRTVRLHFHACTLAGEPMPRLGQALRWVTSAELATIDLPEADREIVQRLRSAPR
jgi:8-oxo-dGTP diphosphatase